MKKVKEFSTWLAGNDMRVKFYFLLLSWILSFGSVHAQMDVVIDGPTEVLTGIEYQFTATETYSAECGDISAMYWKLDGGCGEQCGDIEKDTDYTGTAIWTSADVTDVEFHWTGTDFGCPADWVSYTVVVYQSPDPLVISIDPVTRCVGCQAKIIYDEWDADYWPIDYLILEETINGEKTTRQIDNPVILFDGTSYHSYVEINYDTKVYAGQDVNGLIFPSNKINISDQSEAYNNIIAKSFNYRNGIQTSYTSSKKYFDLNGELLQSQVLNRTTGDVLTSAPIYDLYHRAVGQTLVAPSGQSELGYDTDFLLTTTGEAYLSSDFDQSVPDPVGNSTSGTLGYYYSDNNAEEPYVGATQYPFSRTEYYNDGSGEVKSATLPGEEFIPSTYKKSFTKSFPVFTDLDGKYKEISDLLFGEGPSFQFRAIKSVSRDANGKELVAYKDEKDNVLFSAYGNVDDGVQYSMTISYDPTTSPTPLGYVDIHVPEGSVVNSSNFNNNTVDLVTDIHTIGALQHGFYRVNNPQSFSFELNYYNASFNFYNKRGQLIASVAPKGVELLGGLTLTGENVWDMPFTTYYEYDLQGRMVKMIETDAGETNYMYRKDGSLRFSQNALQKQYEEENVGKGRFSYTNYDKTGRPIESGEYIGTLQYGDDLVPYLETTSDEHDGGGIVGGIGDRNDWIRTYYDRGDAAPGSSLDFNEKQVSLFVYRAEQNDITAEEEIVLEPGFEVPDGAEFEASIGTPTNVPIPEISLPGKQNFVRGAVSHTENKNVKTWYSYDDLGRVKWMATWYKHIFAEPKVVSYEYDFAGNVINIKYQDGQHDAFYHHYVYDADGRLSEVYADVNPIDEANLKADQRQAVYEYYTHGPLKRVELAEGLQGLDYVYTIQGWLKSINNPEGADPGNDELDVFAQSFRYYEDDYERTGSAIASAAPDQPNYNGNISSLKYQTYTGTEQVSHGWNEYTYDDRYYLKESEFEGTSSAFDVFGINYDANGNLETLVRLDETGADLHKFYGEDALVYEEGTNQLIDAPNYADYTYNAIGQMETMTREGEATYIYEYDVAGKVKSVRQASDQSLVMDYEYDDRGFRIRKVNHQFENAGTVYVRDASGSVLAVYEEQEGVMVIKEHPVYGSARLGTYDHETYQSKYELKDHLGNVHAVVSTNDLTVYDRSFDDGVGMEDDEGFSSDEFRSPGGSWFLEDDWSYLDIPVLAGDLVSISVWMKGHTESYLQLGTPYTNRAENLLGENGEWNYLSINEVPIEASGTVRVWMGTDNSHGTYFDDLVIRVKRGIAVTYARNFDDGRGMVENGGFSTSEYRSSDKSWEVIDEDSYLEIEVNEGDVLSASVWAKGNYESYLSISGYNARADNDNGGNGEWNLLEVNDVVMTHTGTQRIWLGSASIDGCYFDDLTITVVRDVSPDVDVTYRASYYPFGLTMERYGDAYRYGYQGDFAEDDTEETGFNHFELRDYDPVIGRWLATDPYRQFASPYIGMGNNPIMGIDPDGGKVLDDYHIDGDGNITNVVTTNDNFDRIIQNGTEIFRTAEGTFLQDFTTMFNEVLAGTELTFSEVARQIDIKYSNRLGGWGGKAYDRLSTFNDLVTDGAVFDLKAQGMGLKELGMYSIYDNKIFRYDDYGNYNYGLAARAFGFSRFTAELGAGINQLSKGFRLGYISSGDLHGFPTIKRTNIPLGGPGTYFDESRDNQAIRMGYGH